MAKIYKRNKVWYLTDYYRGRRCRKRISRSRKTAELAFSDLQIRMDREDLGLANMRNSTFKKLFDEYLEYSRVNKSRSSYERDLQITSAHVIPYLGDKILREITSKMIEGYIIKRSAAVKDSTVNRELNTIFNMFHKAMAWSYIQKNPCQGVKKLKEKKINRSKVFIVSRNHKSSFSMPRKNLCVSLPCYPHRVSSKQAFQSGMVGH
jgi:hypothetical protein